MPDMAIKKEKKKGKDGRLEVDPEAAKVVKMIFQMAAEGTSFADITNELNRQAIATCDKQKLSRGNQVQFQRFDTIKKKHWSATTVAAIVRDEIYIGTRIWGKTRCSMHTGHKAVLNDETEWVRLENHHTAIIDRAFSAKRNRASTEMLRCPNQWEILCAEVWCSCGNRWRRISLGLFISMQRQCWKKERMYLPKGNVNVKRSILQNCKNRADS